MLNKSEIDYTLYLVTDRGFLGQRDLARSVKEAILGGVTLVQLREKDVSSLDFYVLAQKVKAVTDHYQIPLIINDRLDIALAVGAAGLHVGQDDLPAAVARRILGPDKILGVSAARLEEALRAQEEGADYLGVGAVFPTATKDDVRRVAADELQKLKKAVTIPVVAIGGINEQNLPDLRETGIDGIAVVSAILNKEDIQKAAGDLRKLLKRHFPPQPLPSSGNMI